MAQISFNVADHKIKPDQEVVEIRWNGEVCGVIYVSEPDGIKIVSAHMTSVAKITHAGWVPHIQIVFEPRQWGPSAEHQLPRDPIVDSVEIKKDEDSE